MIEIIGTDCWSEDLSQIITQWGGEIDADKWSQVAEDKKLGIIQTAKDVNVFIIWLRTQNPSSQEEMNMIFRKDKEDFSDLHLVLKKHERENTSLRALHSFVGNMIDSYVHYLEASIRHPNQALKDKSIYEEQLDFAQTQVKFIIAQEINLQ